jgi:hypothetical protein
MIHQLNDSLDDIFGAPAGDVRVEPIRPAPEFKSAEQRFEEKCSKCRGTGRFVSYSGRTGGQCFACKGAGKFTFKTSPETRAAQRANKAVSAERKYAEAVAAFAAQQPEVAAWIEAQMGRFDFAAKMRDAVVRFGDLTDGQLAACVRLLEKDKARAAERIERTQNAPQVDMAGIDRLKVAFDKARAYAAAKAPGVSIRNPKITIGGMTISPAKAESKNPGALYVKSGGEYLGKIADGKFLSVQGCSPAQREQVLKFVADPAEAAKVYGQETGVCCVCNATLKSKWRLAGIGPVCAEKMGWAGLAEDFGGLPE